jgi:stress response protein SCP2
MGDNLTGAGDGDDEQVFIDLSSLPAQYEKIVILVSIYEAQKRKQHFGMIQNAFIRIVDADTNKELCIYNLSENYSGKIAMLFGEVYRHSGEWEFSAIGEGLNVSNVGELAARYGLR